MHLIARLLGLAAAIGNRTSRFSINGFQLNWLLLVALGVGVSFTSRELHYAMQNSAEPSVLRVNQASSSESFVGSFVKVVGTLYAEPLFTRERTRRGSPLTETSYYVILDRESKHGMLVETRGEARPNHDQGGTVGMLMPMPAELKARVDELQKSQDSFSIESGLLLECGRRPGSWLGLTILSTVMAAGLVAMSAAWFRRYVIFRESPAPAAVSDPASTAGDKSDALPVVASGVFWLGSVSKRFTNLPAFLVSVDGVPVLCSNVDASTSFMGVKTSDLRGIWVIALPKGAIHSSELGLQFYGLAAKPGIRLQLQDSKKKKQAVVICCADWDSVRAAGMRIFGSASLDSPS